MKAYRKLSFSAVLLSSILSFASVEASPYDLVTYNENETNFLWRIESNGSGSDSIFKYNCPKNKWLTTKNALQECSERSEVVSVSDFKKQVKMIVRMYGLTHPGQDLVEVKANEIKALTEISNYDEQVAIVDKLKDDLKSVDEMLSHLPNSEEYKKTRVDLDTKIKELEKPLESIRRINLSIDELSEKIINLIKFNNADTNELNFYSRSQMKGTLLHEVLSILGRSGLIRTDSGVYFFSNGLNRVFYENDGFYFTDTRGATRQIVATFNQKIHLIFLNNNYHLFFMAGQTKTNFPVVYVKSLSSSDEVNLSGSGTEILSVESNADKSDYLIKVKGENRKCFSRTGYTDWGICK